MPPSPRRGSARWRISFDTAGFDLDRVHRWLSEESYWAAGRPRHIFDKAVRNSLCIGAFAPDGTQVGFARLITDRATFAWLSDVFVEEERRGQGVSTAMMRAILAHPDLATVTRMGLSTRDAHGLYERYGFGPADPARIMQRIEIGATQAEI